MNASMPSSAQPPHAARKPRISLVVSADGDAVAVVVKAMVTSGQAKRGETGDELAAWYQMERAFYPSVRLCWKPAGRPKQGAQIALCIFVPRIDLDRSAEVHDRLLALADRGERGPQVPVRRRGIGRQPQRQPELADRAVDVPCRRGRNPQDVVHLGRFRNDRSQVGAAGDPATLSI